MTSFMLCGPCSNPGCASSCSRIAVIAAAFLGRMRLLALAALPVARKYYDTQPRIKAIPDDVSMATYTQNKGVYDKIQNTFPDGDKVLVGADVLLISGCQDDQTSSDGTRNGLFTQAMLKVWNSGKFTGSYKKFHSHIVKVMPMWQVPNLFQVGTKNAGFEKQTPFTV